MRKMPTGARRGIEAREGESYLQAVKRHYRRGRYGTEVDTVDFGLELCRKAKEGPFRKA